MENGQQPDKTKTDLNKTKMDLKVLWIALVAIALLIGFIALIFNSKPNNKNSTENQETSQVSQRNQDSPNTNKSISKEQEIIQNLTKIQKKLSQNNWTEEEYKNAKELVKTLHADSKKKYRDIRASLDNNNNQEKEKWYQLSQSLFGFLRKVSKNDQPLFPKNIWDVYDNKLIKNFPKKEQDIKEYFERKPFGKWKTILKKYNKIQAELKKITKLDLQQIDYLKKLGLGQESVSKYFQDSSAIHTAVTLYQLYAKLLTE